ncbi:MAG: hypothetical protein AAFY41_14325 [Bacteroidota bacterium]
MLSKIINQKGGWVAKTPGQRPAMWGEGLFWLDFLNTFLSKKKVFASPARGRANTNEKKR